MKKLPLYITHPDPSLKKRGERSRWVFVPLWRWLGGGQPFERCMRECNGLLIIGTVNPL